MEAIGVMQEAKQQSAVGVFGGRRVETENTLAMYEVDITKGWIELERQLTMMGRLRA